MKCPHCNAGIHFQGEKHVYHSEHADGKSLGYEVITGFCPLCYQLIVTLRSGEFRWIDDHGEIINETELQFLYPKFQKRLLDSAIPDVYRKVFEEAVAVLSSSPRASAALSRRLLQQLLRDEFNIHLGADTNLSEEIQEFNKRADVPGDIKNTVDEIRRIGNWAAHPTKYRSTGEIVHVEPYEAEWLLDILEDILDLRFIQPKIEKERLEKYEQKRKNIRR